MKYLAGLLVCFALVGAGVAPRLTRASLQSFERQSDSTIENLLKEDPMSILGYTRGVYLDGYGVVFSTEVDLAPRMNPNPFRAQFTKDDFTRIKELKRLRLVQLREQMRSMLISYASGLDLPLNENVALAVTIPYSRLEDSAGMPRQIVISAPRRALLDAAAGRTAALPETLKVQEFF
ncbi:MAG: hypothetical protein H7Y20_17995 [Bryobacteraceae bacterium]|nr:hypothetical protein [Bryobacteraceae bacterium]